MGHTGWGCFHLGRERPDSPGDFHGFTKATAPRAQRRGEAGDKTIHPAVSSTYYLNREYLHIVAIGKV